MKWPSHLFVLIVLVSTIYNPLFAQEKTPESIAERFFMPAIQIGFINHNSDNLTSGMIIQTSLEYRTKKNVFFRLNYDDFSGRINLDIQNNQTYNARIPISEIIGGIGYRLNHKRHNYFVLAQTGIRFYENPIIQSNIGNLIITQKGSTIYSARYTCGYEFEIFESVFLNSELFVGHFLKIKDFWSNSRPFYGITVGLSARIF